MAAFDRSGRALKEWKVKSALLGGRGAGQSASEAANCSCSKACRGCKSRPSDRHSMRSVTSPTSIHASA